MQDETRRTTAGLRYRQLINTKFGWKFHLTISSAIWSEGHFVMKQFLRCVKQQTKCSQDWLETCLYQTMVLAPTILAQMYVAAGHTAINEQEKRMLQQKIRCLDTITLRSYNFASYPASWNLSHRELPVTNMKEWSHSHMQYFTVSWWWLYWGKGGGGGGGEKQNRKRK